MQIDRDVKLPLKALVTGGTVYPFRVMGIGDSFWVEVRDDGKKARSRVRNALRMQRFRWAELKGMKLAMADEHGGLRVWRVA